MLNDTTTTASLTTTYLNTTQATEWIPQHGWVIFCTCLHLLVL
jgi:hypothetical protein